MEYCPGGNLGELLINNKRFKEDAARFYACEIIIAIGHLHTNNIIFRYLNIIYIYRI